MSILKLQNAGEELTLAVVTAERIPGQYGEQVKFTDKNGDILFVPSSSVERQLDRCGVAEIEELSGTSVHFSRAANNKPGSKPYWNLDRARGGDVVHSGGNGNGAKPSPAPRAYETPTKLPGEPDAAFDNLINRYGECLTAANREIAPVLKASGYTVTAETLASIAATLFIQRTRANV